MQVARDLEPYVQPHEIREPERAHRVPVSELHRAVDVLGGRDAGLDHPDRLEAECDAESRGSEAGGVTDHDGLLAHALGGFAGTLDGVGRGTVAPDDLDERHDVDRVEEVHAHDPFLSGDRLRDRGDRQRGGVGGQQRVRLHGLGGAREDLLLQLHHLRNRLDDDLGPCHRLGGIGRGAEAAERGVADVGLHFSELDALVELCLHAPHRALEGLVAHVCQSDVVACDSRDLRDPVAHRAGSEDGQYRSGGSFCVRHSVIPGVFPGFIPAFRPTAPAGCSSRSLCAARPRRRRSRAPPRSRWPPRCRLPRRGGPPGARARAPSGRQP